MSNHHFSQPKYRVEPDQNDLFHSYPGFRGTRNMYEEKLRHQMGNYDYGGKMAYYEDRSPDNIDNLYITPNFTEYQEAVKGENDVLAELPYTVTYKSGPEVICYDFYDDGDAFGMLRGGRACKGRGGKFLFAHRRKTINSTVTPFGQNMVHCNFRLKTKRHRWRAFRKKYVENEWTAFDIQSGIPKGGRKWVEPKLITGKEPTE